MSGVAIHMRLHDAVDGPRGDDVVRIGLINGYVWRGQHRVRMSRRARTLLVALCLHPGRMWSMAELADCVFGLDADGGPENGPGHLRVALHALRVAGPLLGISVETHGKRICVRPTCTAPT